MAESSYKESPKKKQDGNDEGSGRAFVGTLDDIRISNLQMGADEIAALYVQRPFWVIQWQEVAPN